MNARNKFLIILAIILGTSTIYYLVSTPRSSDLVLIGTVDSNQIIVSPQMQGRIGLQRSGGNPMNDSRFSVEHVRLAIDKPFEDVAKAFERQLGRFDPDVYRPKISDLQLPRPAMTLEEAMEYALSAID